MHRIVAIASVVLVALLVLVPVAAAAEPIYEDGRVIVTIRGDITFPAGEAADTMVVIDGRATIEGDVREIFVLNGTATLSGARTEGIVALGGHVVLGPDAVVAGDVKVLGATVEQAAGSSVEGRIDNGLDLAGFALFIGPALFVAYLGFVIAAIAAAVALASVASRQVRAATALISHEPATTFVAGLAGLAALIAAGSLAIVTIVGIPLGLGILIGVLPGLVFVGYLVTGIWVGDTILNQSSTVGTGRRPYLAAVVGMLVLAVVSFIPVVGGLVAFMGFGAVILSLWRTIRGPADGVAPAASAAAPAGAVG
jgi:hypothetical protein